MPNRIQMPQPATLTPRPYAHRSGLVASRWIKNTVKNSNKVKKKKAKCLSKID